MQVSNIHDFDSIPIPYQTLGLRISIFQTGSIYHLPECSSKNLKLGSA